MSLDKSLLQLKKLQEEEMEWLTEEEPEQKQEVFEEDLDFLTNAFKKSCEVSTNDGFIRSSITASNHNSSSDAEIYQDTLSLYNNATNVSKSELSRVLSDFSNQKLPKFKKGKKFYNATILFNNVYISKTAMETLNKDFNYRIDWKAGFLIGYNVPIIAFTYWRYKNRDSYYTNLVDTLLKKRAKAYGKHLQVIGGRYQLLNGRACKPIFPIIDGITFGKRNAWNFVGE